MKKDNWQLLKKNLPSRRRQEIKLFSTMTTKHSKRVKPELRRLRSSSPNSVIDLRRPPEISKLRELLRRREIWMKQLKKLCQCLMKNQHKERLNSIKSTEYSKPERMTSKLTWMRLKDLKVLFNLIQTTLKHMKLIRFKLKMQLKD